jgi:four helix bundle protein
VKNFRDLQVWLKAHELTLAIYRCTEMFPKREMFGLTSQMRRCSTSIPSNIAEGCGRRGNGDFHRFLSIAAGSASELEYQLLLSHDLHFIRGEEYEGLAKGVIEVKKMLAALACKVDAERTASKCG